MEKELELAAKSPALAVVREGTRLPALPAPMAEGPEPGGGPLPLAHYFWLLRRHRWKMLAFIAVVMAVTAAVSMRLTPVYEATATVDIDRQTPQAVIGQESMRSMLNDADQFLATQLRLMQSDSVLRPVARRFGLEAAGPMKDAPVLLKQLRVLRPPNTYLLLVSYRSPDPRQAAAVANAIAESYLEHTYNTRLAAAANLSRFMERELGELKAKMERSSLALSQFERELNVIQPEEKTNILSARLLQLNQEYTAAQADRVRKESAHGLARGGTLEAAQVSTQGEALKRLTERLNEVREKFAEAKSQYGAGHPQYKRLAAQEAELERQIDQARQNILSRIQVEYREAAAREGMLAKEVAATKAEFDRLNTRSFGYQQLKREADADKRLYEELVRKIKEAGINAGFQNSSIRIADLARTPYKPVFPNTPLNLLVAFLLATMTAVGVALASDALDNTIREPDEAARSLGTVVVGTLPVVKRWRGRLGVASTPSDGTALERVGSGAAHDLAGFGESVRTLRNSILLSDFDRRYRSLLVTSASPGEGKSTTAAHLALAHAEQGQKTLLIDGDLRRPSVHRRFNLTPQTGLSSALLGEIGWREGVIPMEGTPNLHILPAGAPSRRAGDLMGRGLEEIIAEATLEYDLIVLDAPPLIGFSEPLQMATAVDGVVVVARAGETNRKSVNAVLTTLERLRVHVVGLVLNGVHKELGESYYYYGHYRRYYHANS